MRTTSPTVEIKPGVRFDKAWLKDTLFLTDDEADALGVNKYDGAILFGQIYKLDAQQMTALLSYVYDQDTMVQALTSGAHSYSLQSYCEELSEPLDIVETITFSREKTVPEHNSLLASLFEAHQVGITALVVEIADKFSKFLGTLPGHESKLEVQRLNKVNRRTGMPVMTRPRIEHSNLLPNLLIIDVSSSQGRDLIESIVDNCIDLAVKYEMHLVLVSHIAEWFVPGTFDRDTVMESNVMSGGTVYRSMADIGVASQNWGTVVTVADIDGQKSDMTAWQKAGGTIDKVVDISTVSGQTWLSEIVAVQSTNKVQQLVVAPGSYLERAAYEASMADLGSYDEGEDEPWDEGPDEPWGADGIHW